MESEFLTVGSLIEKLKNYDRDLPVMVYSEMDEGGGIADEVYLEESEGQTYFQDDHPFSFSISGIKKAVLIKAGANMY